TGNNWALTVGGLAVPVRQRIAGGSACQALPRRCRRGPDAAVSPHRLHFTPAPHPQRCSTTVGALLVESPPVKILRQASKAARKPNSQEDAAAGMVRAGAARSLACNRRRTTGPGGVRTGCPWTAGEQQA